MMEFSPGAEIAGYRIESVIGRGGMAVVYRAEDSRLGRKVALKLLAPVLAQNQHFQQRFIRESRLAASLDHPNIVPIYEAGESEGHLFIAMRYVPGSDLKGVLRQDERMPPARLLRLFVQIGDALDAAHLLGLVHRDVKPGNILVSSVLEHAGHAHPDHVYLTDFGLTKRTSSLSGSITETGHFLGTVDYVSPEQIQGGPVSPATDNYALGCVLYESLTGQLPFNRDDDAAVLWAHLVEMPPPVTAARPDLPPAIDDVVNRAMCKAPEDRYDTCSEMMRDLEQALAVDIDLSGLHSASSRSTARHRPPAGTGSTAMPSDPSSGASLLGTAVPPEVDPDATRAWVSHPSLPPGAMDPPRWQAPLDDPTASAEPSPPDADVAGAGVEVEGYRVAEPHEDTALRDDDPQYDADYGGTSLDEYPDDEQPAAPSAAGVAVPDIARRSRLLPAAAVALLALVGALTVFLLRSQTPEPLVTYTASTQQSRVAFSIDHPQSWKTMPISNAVVISKAPQVRDVFTGPGGWATARAVVKSSPDQAVGVYFTSLAVRVNTDPHVLQAWVASTLNNSSVTALTSPTQTTIGGRPGFELTGTLADTRSPEVTLKAVFDVVLLPQGTALITFFAAPSQFEDQRHLFTEMRGSVEFQG